MLSKTLTDVKRFPCASMHKNRLLFTPNIAIWSLLSAFSNITPVEMMQRSQE